MKNSTWHPVPRLDEETWLRWPKTECCTITSSNLVPLCVCFLRLKKQRLHGKVSKNKY